VQTGERKREKE